MFSIDQQLQDQFQDDMYLSPSQFSPTRALWDDNDFPFNGNMQTSTSRATSPIFITKKWNPNEELSKAALTSSGGSTVFDSMNGLDALMELDFGEPMSAVENAIEDEYITAAHTPSINDTYYKPLIDSNVFSPQLTKQLSISNFKKSNIIEESSMTPITSNSVAGNSVLSKVKSIKGVEDCDSIYNNISIGGVTANTIKVKKVYNNKGKSISDSRLSTESLRQSFQLPSAKAATRLEAHVEKLLTDHCNFQLGYKTWVRDTEKDERDHILNILEQKLNEDMDFLSGITGKTKKIEKRSIETIVRKCTYAKQQSRLRKERRKAVDMSNKLVDKKV